MKTWRLRTSLTILNFGKPSRLFLQIQISNSRNKITLIKKDVIIFSSKDVPETFKTFFVNTVEPV